MAAVTTPLSRLKQLATRAPYLAGNNVTFAANETSLEAMFPPKHTLTTARVFQNAPRFRGGFRANSACSRASLGRYHVAQNGIQMFGLL